MVVAIGLVVFVSDTIAAEHPQPPRVFVRNRMCVVGDGLRTLNSAILKELPNPSPS